MLAAHGFSFTQADPVLARAGAAYRQRMVDHRLIDNTCLVPTRHILDLQYEEDMEIAVTDMTQYRSKQAGCLYCSFGAGDGIAQMAYRHTDIGDPCNGSGNHIFRSP